MIYQRDEEDHQTITNFNVVFKGTWNMGQPENAEEFIYKKIGAAEQDDLLARYYCDNPIDDRVKKTEYPKES